MEVQTASSSLAENIATSIGVQTDLVKTMILMITSVVLAPAFHMMEVKSKHFYSFFLGLAYVYYLQDVWTLFVILVCLVPFLLIKFFPKFSFFITIATSFTFLLFIHSYRFIFDYDSWKIDCSVIIMYLVTKITYYGYHIEETGEVPNFLEYISYCFFFPSVMIGPTFSFALFRNFIEKQNTPLRLKSIIGQNLIVSLILVILTGLTMPIFNPYWILENETFLSLSPLCQFLSLNFIGVIYRLKFYMAWSFTQMSINLSGLSQNSQTGEFDKVLCGSYNFELVLNPREKTSYWNTSIQLWLKNIVYTKFLNLSKSSTIATYLTFLVSAFWHGIYLTYYIGFIQWAIIIQISKWAYKITQAIPQITKSIQIRIVGYIMASSFINYTGMFIVILSWNEAVEAYENMHYYGNFIMGILLVLSVLINPKALKMKIDTPIQC